jgi:glycosyltransferase involved in cell wall biosynthesis
MTVLIPAYEPDERLIKLIQELIDKCEYEIVVVDDGSGSDFNNIFANIQSMGCTVLTHVTNRGKGCALKTGFDYIHYKTGEMAGVVTADADGQHLVADIIRIADAIPLSQDKIILGVRKFVGKVPPRSIIGNTVTRTIFAHVSGEKIKDTQTGLRGFPVALLPWLICLEGQRFEYEMNMLLEAKPSGYQFTQIDIETVYLAGNKSSHFRIIQDSVRIYIPFLKFSISEISCVFIDYFLLFFIQSIIRNLLISVIASRLASSTVKFIANRSFAFESGKKRKKLRTEMIHYYIPVGILLLFNYLFLRLLSQGLGMNLFLSKVLTDLILFCLSYSVQHLFVFKKAKAVI